MQLQWRAVPFGIVYESIRRFPEALHSYVCCSFTKKESKFPSPNSFSLNYYQIKNSFLPNKQIIKKSNINRLEKISFSKTQNQSRRKIIPATYISLSLHDNTFTRNNSFPINLPKKKKNSINSPPPLSSFPHTYTHAIIFIQCTRKNRMGRNNTRQYPSTRPT